MFSVSDIGKVYNLFEMCWELLERFDAGFNKIFFIDQNVQLIPQD